MPSAPRVVALSSVPPFDGGPVDVARCWPESLPLIMLASARPHPRWSRWSILATPSRWLDLGDEEEPDPLGALEAALAATRTGIDEACPIPFTGGWIGALSYELGRLIEPRCRVAGERRRPDRHRWSAASLARCERALVHDARGGRWWSIAPVDDEPIEALLDPSFDARRDGRGEWELKQPKPTARDSSVASEWHCTSAAPTTSREAWLDAVRRVIEYIRAGDVFQVNLTHLLRVELTAQARPRLPESCTREPYRRVSTSIDSAPSVRAFALDALSRAEAWHGALLELPDGSAIVSFSPELFLGGSLCGERSIVTRPIKGTRPAGAAPESLLGSAKDQAELNMIIDLMRNDLGRIALPGSVRVEEPRHVERHPTVLQAVATVAATLRDGVSIGDVLRATFPPGSVTGAPKIRAMQIIEELEPFGRGPYCGAIGSFADSGPFSLSVAIRTLSIAPPRDGAATALYGVGCGIVADSDPEAEWQESLDKAAVLDSIRGAAGGS